MRKVQGEAVKCNLSSDCSKSNNKVFAIIMKPLEEAQKSQMTFDFPVLPCASVQASVNGYSGDISRCKNCFETPSSPDVFNVPDYLLNVKLLMTNMLTSYNSGKKIRQKEISVIKVAGRYLAITNLFITRPHRLVNGIARMILGELARLDLDSTSLNTGYPFPHERTEENSSGASSGINIFHYSGLFIHFPQFPS
jgi:hypothetical protein